MTRWQNLLDYAQPSMALPFNRDFILKTCLILLDQGARYEVEKFRKKGVREEIEKKWDDDRKSDSGTFSTSCAARLLSIAIKHLPTYLVLIPLDLPALPFRRQLGRPAKDVDTYLLRCSLVTGAFGGQPGPVSSTLSSRTLRKSKSFQPR